MLFIVTDKCIQRNIAGGGSFEILKHDAQDIDDSCKEYLTF